VANNAATLLTHLQHESKINSSNKDPTSYETAHYKIAASATSITLWRWEIAVAPYEIEVT
jgi:hypothetical protein